MLLVVILLLLLLVALEVNSATDRLATKSAGVDKNEAATAATNEEQMCR